MQGSFSSCNMWRNRG